MDTRKIPLLIVIIISFVIGAWSIALVLLIFYIIPSSKKVDKNQTPEQRIQELEAENEKLQAELDQQLVQRVMDKVENRGEGR